MDNEFLDSRVTDVLQFWHGRKPRGVPVDLSRRCKCVVRLSYHYKSELNLLLARVSIEMGVSGGMMKQGGYWGSGRWARVKMSISSAVFGCLNPPSSICSVSDGVHFDKYVAEPYQHSD